MLTKAMGDRSGSLQAKVLDFGLARRSVEPESHGSQAETREADPLTRNEGLVGTMPYMHDQLDPRRPWVIW